MSSPLKLLLVALLIAGAWAALSVLEPDTRQDSCGTEHAGGGG